MSKSLAESSWPGESALGKEIAQGGDEARAWRVVGVVGDVAQTTLREASQPTMYRPVAQMPAVRLHLVARTAADPLALLPQLREAVWAVDPETTISEATTMTALVGESTVDDRFRAILLWTFAGIAIVLATVGVFAVTARAVSARSREFGIRLAVEARAHHLFGLALTEGLVGAGIGIGLGLVGSLWATGLVRNMLYQVTTRDPATYVVACCLAGTACLLASSGPARRVIRISPRDSIVGE